MRQPRWVKDSVHAEGFCSNNQVGTENCHNAISPGRHGHALSDQLEHTNCLSAGDVGNIISRGHHPRFARSRKTMLEGLPTGV